ncbi:hypothetical protein ACLBW2_12080 [Enterobacteriaceae bacterium C23F]
MANTNNFKAFALDPNANVMSQADWEALPALLSGFTAGKASSAQVNKAIRQSTTIGAVIGQFIANSGVDALDDGDIAGLVTKFTDAIIANLNLEGLLASPRYLVSKGSNANGWYEIYSDGFKRVGQSWSTPLSIPTPASGVRVNYPISFTSKLNGLYVTENGNTSNNFEFANPAAIGLTGFNMATMEATLGTSVTTSYGSTFTGYYLAEGY